MFSGDHPRSTLSSRVRRGGLVRLANGVYTTDIQSRPEDVVRAHCFEIVGRLFLNAVITDRSARTGSVVDGVLYLARDARPRDFELPGLRVRARRGAAPQAGDIAYPGGLFLASRARGLAENCLPTRSRGSDARRTLDAEELGDWVDYICQNDGSQRLFEYRHDAEVLAPTLGVKSDHLALLQSLVGIAVGTRPRETTKSRSLSSRRLGRPVDQVRVRRFEHLTDALRSSAPQSRPLESAEPSRYSYLPFFDAYFSNFIEGTEFDVDEAARIVFDGVIPANRPADAHDILGTYRLLSDQEEMVRTGSNVEEFLALIRRRNAAILEGRPAKRPGQFKELANRVGATFFVEPQLVEGTIAAAFRLRDGLDTAWERAVYVAFVVAEVHPFDDGNGRTARVMMNAELTAGGQCQIIIPTVFRQDYLDGLRMLSTRDDSTVLIKAMRYAHDFTASIDFSDYTEAKRQLAAANAFEDSDSPRRFRVLLQRPVEAPSVAPWRQFEE